MGMKYSILYPAGDYTYRKLDAVTMHDLGLEKIVRTLSDKEAEQNLCMDVLANVTAAPQVSQYRLDVFEDILTQKKMREDLAKVFDRINFLHDYGRLQRDYDEKASAWELVHRLEELKDYIDCVDALHDCLADAAIKSEGLIGLKSYIEEIYQDNAFAELKRDISELKASTSNLKSVTVGINLNDHWEAESIGLISVNAKPFTKSNALKNFYDKIVSSGTIHEDTEWKEDFKYQPFGAGDSLVVNERAAIAFGARTNPLMAGMALAPVPEKDTTRDITQYMDHIVNHMLSGLVKKIRQTLNRYVSITITDLTDLIPEFVYYTNWAAFIEKYEAEGYKFCKPAVVDDMNSDGVDVNRIDAGIDAGHHGTSDLTMRARGLYNLKLAALSDETMDTIVTNDLDFDQEHLVYILTGANRGGKTTITQAIGQMFLLAQGGIYVPADTFAFSPADMVYTHFPADEDKTMDLGRLGEECSRFREIYAGATEDTLLLLNETFSTTSFEEGYYIARDAVKAILHKGCRTIYNTHMHKLAFDIEELNESAALGKASSLVVLSEEGKRSYKVAVCPPGGRSYAEDIARKYGVTYEMLVSHP